MTNTLTEDRRALLLAKRLRRDFRGSVHGDSVTRGLYATDASIYQVIPALVAMPADAGDLKVALEWARNEGIPVTARGAGTSQGGQAIGPGLVLDFSRHMNDVLAVDTRARTALVQPGVVLDDLNRRLRSHSLTFPVDVATGSRATIGGMAGNNSAGARSIRHGHMVDNVRGVHAILSDGRSTVLTTSRGRPTGEQDTLPALARQIEAIRHREEDELARRIPPVARHVAGYNLHRLRPGGEGLGDLLVGAEGTLALYTALELALVPSPRHSGLAVCRFPSLAAALRAVPSLVELKPSAVELVDGTVIERAWALPRFRAIVEQLARAETQALLFVEFQGERRPAVAAGIDATSALLASSGHRGAVVRAETPEFQASIWALRRAGMNLVTSTKSARKPVSFLEDCAVPVDRLAEYAERVTEIFTRHGLRGTWYAHASVGCLHVRPALDLKTDDDLGRMRPVAEEMLDVVRDLGGSHSGEHGDGRIRSEFLAPMLGERMVRAFADVKDAFDPERLLNPGVIVEPPRMDDRRLLRYGPDYRELPVVTGLDWSEWGSFLAATEACNNNGQCRKRAPGVMCPSFRVTDSEQDVTRGRANALRLALSGQLGSDALATDALHEVLDLCVGCKACRTECPAGVDVSRMKTEVLHQRRARHGLSRRTRVFGHLPRVAPRLSRFPGLANLARRSVAVGSLLRRTLGIARHRALPEWSRSPWTAADLGPGRASPGDRDVFLMVDTFSRYFEPENARAAAKVLRHGGYEVREVSAPPGQRPLCCGRTYLSAGMIDEAREEARRFCDALERLDRRHAPVVGLEPSCVLTLRDEWPALLPDRAIPERPALLLEEFLLEEKTAGRLSLPLGSGGATSVAIHTHCHQKAFGLKGATERVLRWVPGLHLTPLATGCCGMAGSFGYEEEHVEVSIAMAQLELVPALAGLPEQGRVIANGTSCRHQIEDLAGRASTHLAVILAEAIG